MRDDDGDPIREDDERTETERTETERTETERTETERTETERAEKEWTDDGTDAEDGGSGDDALDGRVADARWFDAITRSVADGIYQLDRQGRFVRVNQTVVDVTGYSREELLGRTPALILTDESFRQSLEAVRRLLESDDDVAAIEMTVVNADGEELPVENRLALLWADGEFRGTAGIVRDISDRKRRERQLEEQRDELERLNRINSVIRETIRTLVEASSREEVTEPVCQRLAASTAYRAAWVGDHGGSDGRVVPITCAGVDRAIVERHVETLAERANDDDLAGAPFRTGRVEASDVPADDPIRERLGDDGHLAMAAVPLVYGETVYGVLYVYTDRVAGFGDGELEVLEELGETIGLALNAIEARRLLYADTVTELEFQFDDPEQFAAALTAETDVTVEFESLVPGSEGEWLAYASVTGGDPEPILQRARDHAAVADASIVNSGEEGDLLLLTVTGRTPITTMREAGGRIERAVVDDGVGRVVGIVASETDTRQVVEQFQRSFPEASLVAQREVERPVETPGEFRRDVLETLTEKQRRALETAFYGRYFERPRPTTGTELAETLGVTPSTFHQHLQAGLRKVLRVVFDPAED